MILEKALAVAFGGYSRLGEASTGKLFQMLTGSNSVGFKIREEYEKNDNLWGDRTPKYRVPARW